MDLKDDNRACISNLPPHAEALFRFVPIPIRSVRMIEEIAAHK